MNIEMVWQFFIKFSDIKLHEICPVFLSRNGQSNLNRHSAGLQMHIKVGTWISQKLDSEYNVHLLKPSVLSLMAVFLLVRSTS
jgi:hypothetical protein